MRPIAVLPVLAALLLAACSAPPAASLPSASPSGAPSAAPSAPPSSNPTASPSAPRSLPPSPTPRPSPSVPVVGQAPAGPWTSVHWVDTGRLPLGPTAVSVHGWSEGYVAFEQSPGYDAEGSTEVPVVIRASASSDGVEWSTPVTLETGFKGSFRIESVIEGPNGLLALGYPYGDTCGGPEPLTFLWASSDGRSWERLPMPRPFASSKIETISGGEAGYIAFGTKSDGETRAIWTSADGRAWTARPLPTVSRGTVAIDAATSFADGFALVGSVLGEEGCGGASHIKPAIWSSADGAAWTRASLPGASTDRDARLTIERIGDRLLVTQILPADGSPVRGWTSRDGRTWTAVGELSADLSWAGASDGRHVIAVIAPESGEGAMSVVAVDGDGAIRTLPQSEIGPVASEARPEFVYSPGPTGILVVVPDGSASWLGVPS